MKKLLGILGTITIAGSGISGIVGNAPASEKNEINYSKTNNLENLKRNKREIIDSNRKIKFNVLNNEYRGELGLDTNNKKIIFSGNDSTIHSYYGGLNSGGSLFFEIIIKDLNQNIIKVIPISSKNTMRNVINYFNLQNGINYQDGYTIEINSQEAWRTLFNVGTKNVWEEVDSHIKKHHYWQALWKFWINNNQLVEYDKKIIFFGYYDDYKGHISLNSVNKKILFFGYYDDYKGHISLNSVNKKILFFGNHEQFHEYFDGKKLNSKEKIYNKIIIKNENNQLIKEIIINGTESMQDIISKYNLQNGINYQDGCSLEILSTEPSRTKVFLASKWWNIHSDLKKISLKINNNQLVEYDKKINFLGLGDDYKGEIGLDTINKKIRFFGNNEWFHSYYDGSNNSSPIYNKIIIKNQNNQIIKEIIINGSQSMQNIIYKYNLQNGINYQNDYIIDVWSSEPWRVQFYKNNNWKYITKNRNLDRTINNLKQAFKIKNNKFSEYKYQLNNIITITNLKSIEKNTDKTILNELNYLNPDLNISKIEVTDKTNISATIKAKNNSNNYIGSVNIHYAINNNQKNKIINLNELIKKGIFLSFRDKNQGITIKEIKNINTNNLIYSNVTATKSIEPIYNKNSKSICFGTTTLFHNLPEKQNMKTPSCKYTKETTISTQITKGFSREETDSKTSDMKHNWNFELGVSVHGEAGVWPFAKVSTDINTKVEVGGEYGSSETKTLSNKMDFSNSKTNEYKEISEVELPSQEIEVNPNQKIKVTASLDEVLAQVTLKLTQNIYGKIISQITNTSNEEKSFKISIKEVMQKLKEYNLLPQEITINNDDSIIFNGNANRSLKKGFDGNIEFHVVK